MAKFKIKTNKSGAKRFKITGSGKIKRKRANLRHNMRRRQKDTKRVLRQMSYVSSANHDNAMALLPNG